MALRVAINGFGRIGRATARRSTGFGMVVKTYMRTVGSGDPIPEGVELCASMEEVLATSDFVSLHLPLSDQTRKWFNAERIAIMKPGAIVINTARGGLIDEAALVAALHSGQLGGAGLDVFEGEPNIWSELASAPNTYLLPHVGSATVETRRAMGDLMVENLVLHFAGKPVKTPVPECAAVQGAS